MVTIDHLKHRRPGFCVGLTSFKDRNEVRAQWRSPVVVGDLCEMTLKISKADYADPATKACAMSALLERIAESMDAEDARLENDKARAAASIKSKVGKPKKWAEIKNKK